jgi:S-layer homology domain
MERFIGAISLTVLLMGLTAVAQVQPQPEGSGSLSKLMRPTAKTLLAPDKAPADPPITRADLAQLLVKTFQLRPLPQKVQAKDVPESYWAHSEIQTILSRGIMTRDRQGKFHPNQPVSRAEALATLAKAQGKKPLSTPTVNDILSRYPDAIQIATADRSAIAASLKTGILSLESGKIAPHAPITRNDMVHALSAYQGDNKK